jgi:nascent polypeptide-associated complex subunit alpha
MGFRGMSPRNIERMMKRMGIEQEELEGVKEVVIRFADKEWVIDKAQVVMIKQPTGDSYQVTGQRRERKPSETGPRKEVPEVPQKKTRDIPIEDAALVAGQTGVTIEAAMQALKESDGDLAAAILKLRRG